MSNMIDNLDVFALRILTGISLLEISQALNVPCPSDQCLEKILDESNISLDEMYDFCKCLSSGGRELKKKMALRRVILGRINEFWRGELKRKNVSFALAKEIATSSYADKQTKTQAIRKMAELYKKLGD